MYRNRQAYRCGNSIHAARLPLGHTANRHQSSPIQIGMCRLGNLRLNNPPRSIHNESNLHIALNAFLNARMRIYHVLIQPLHQRSFATREARYFLHFFCRNQLSTFHRPVSFSDVMQCVCVLQHIFYLLFCQRHRPFNPQRGWSHNVIHQFGLLHRGTGLHHRHSSPSGRHSAKLRTLLEFTRRHLHQPFHFLQSIFQSISHIQAHGQGNGEQQQQNHYHSQYGTPIALAGLTTKPVSAIFPIAAFKNEVTPFA